MRACPSVPAPHSGPVGSLSIDASATCPSINNHATNGLAGMHEIKCIVDALERHLVRDQRINGDLAVHIPIDDLWNVRAPPRPTERCALPYPTCHELEGTCLYLLPCPGDTDDNRNTPAAMTTFERLAHQLHVANAFEAVVGATVSECHQMSHQVCASLFGVDEMCHAELLGQRL